MTGHNQNLVNLAAKAPLTPLSRHLAGLPTCRLAVLRPLPDSMSHLWTKPGNRLHRTCLAIALFSHDLSWLVRNETVEA